MREFVLWAGYNAGLLLLSPVWLPYVAWRAAFGNLRGGWRERLGLPPRAPEGRERVLVHAASCGEVQAAVPIIRELRKLAPDVWLGLSVLTSTGFEVARKAKPPVDAILRPPLDLPFAASLSMARIRPHVLCLVETELWPNLLFAAKRWGARCLLLSARFQRAARNGLSRAVAGLGLSKVDKVLAQTERDAELAAALGADGKVEVSGNVKFDTALSPLPEREKEALRRELGLKEGQILVAGSTHPGEEEAVAEALSRLRGQFPSLRAVVAPRRVERAAEVQEVFGRRGFAVARRTRPDASPPRPDVVVLDTMGELARVYAIADVAFVGGSLAPVGGHSLIEPMAQGVPVLFGPNVWNFRDVAGEVVRSGAGLMVKDASALAEAVGRLLSDGELRRRMTEAALAVVERNRGAARRCAEAILGCLREG